MLKNNKKFLISLFVSVTVVFCILLLLYHSKILVKKQGESAYSIAKTIDFDPKKLYSVANVVDGDTLKINIANNIITVRMLGINTPETVDPRKEMECFGLEASKESKSLLEGQKIFISLNPNRESKDKYGRLLAYVNREDGLFVNEFLIQEGYAREYTFGSSYLYQNDFKKVEQLARENKKGLWKECMLK